MKQLFFFSAVALSLITLIACGGSNGKMETQSNGESSMASMQKNDSMKSLQEWIRSEPVDVKAVDENHDGYVYQDQMDWNVIADEEGKCPKCGMFLKKVTIDEAIKNLTGNGYKIK